MKFIKIEENKEQCMDLFLEADPDREVIESYLKKGEVYAILENKEIICEAVVLPYDANTVELKNIATKEEYRGAHYASQMIEYLFSIYRRKYKKMIVGTSERMIPFYVLHGFTQYHHTVKNFFVDNYKEEIWDGNFLCMDIHYYEKKF